MCKRLKFYRITLCVILALLFQMFSCISFTTVKVQALEKLDDLSMFGRLSKEEIDTIGHVRVTDRFMDEMNMIEYENRDGSYTAYLFSKPIKYLDTQTNTIRYIRDENDVQISQAQAGALTASADPVSYLPIEDTMVNSNLPTNNYSTFDSLTVGHFNEGASRREIYVKFDLSAIRNVIRYDQVISACFAMHQIGPYAMNESFSVACYRVTENWNSTTVTWNTKPDCDPNHLSVESVYQSSDDDTDERLRYHYFVITQLAQGWLQGIENYGLAFKCLTKKDVNPDYAFSEADTTRSFASTEGSSDNTAPFFRITYTNNTASLDGIGIKSGSTYFLKQNGLYLTAIGTTISKTTFSGASSQKWTIYESGNGYFYLVPMRDPYTALTYTSSSIKTGEFDATAAFQFKLTRNWNGTYHIATRSYPTKGLGSSSPSGSTLNLRTLTTSLTNYDDWTLEAVGEDTAYWVAASDMKPDFITTHVQGSYKPSFESAGWDFTLHQSVTASNARSFLQNSNYCILNAHGGQGCLKFPDAPTGDTSTWLVANPNMTVTEDASIPTLPIDTLDANSLASVRCVLLAACSNGNDANNISGITDGTTQEVYNLASSIYRKGTHLVISFIDGADAREWYPIFFQQCAQGKTVAEAMAAADTYVLEEGTYEGLGGMLNRTVLGDTSMRLDVHS